jgi:hypothetical protein
MINVFSHSESAGAEEEIMGVVLPTSGFECISRVRSVVIKMDCKVQERKEDQDQAPKYHTSKDSGVTFVGRIMCCESKMQKSVIVFQSKFLDR